MDPSDPDPYGYFTVKYFFSPHYYISIFITTLLKRHSPMCDKPSFEVLGVSTKHISRCRNSIYCSTCHDLHFAFET